MSEYDDDRPDMMRIHVAEDRARGLRNRYTLTALQRKARERGIKVTGLSKHDLSVALASDGEKP